MFELFTEITRGDSLGNVVDLEVEALVDYSERIFKPYEGGRLEEMVESVKAYGIITPIIVRKLNDSYEILSGHNRVKAARILGLERVPALIRLNLSDSEARFIVTESNIVQRGFMELSILERAACIAVRHEAMKHQGIRQSLTEAVDEDSTYRDSDGGKDTDEMLAESFDLSPRNVRRYVRIHSLSSGMKTLIDGEQVGMTAGELLSYLHRGDQEIVSGVALSHGVNISIADAEAIKVLADADGINVKNIEQLLVNMEDAQEITVKLSDTLIEKYFKGYSVEEIHRILELALERYFAKEGGVMAEDAKGAEAYV